MDKKYSGDYIIRGIAADGQIRLFGATTKNMVEEARSRHNTSPVVTAALGRLLTAAAMMGAMMKGENDKLTLKIRGDGPVGAITAAADSHGHVKGFAANPQVLIHANAKGKLDVAGAIGSGSLEVVKDIGMKEPYMGSCQLVSGEIAEDLTYYFAASEQTPSAVALGVLMNKDNTVCQAGGFILQIMPGISDETISVLEKKLGEITSITSMLDQGMTPEDIFRYIAGDFGVEITDKESTAFCCDCSKEKVTKAVISLGRKDLEELSRSEEPVEVHCDFCNTNYYFEPEELQKILDLQGKNEK